ncbi:hypothetical protein CAPTEDRAFT_229342 [Capitella teleta]|uniref:Uncharacterized protein n=1 Tax=Capitella teleta TaxID=283909 RepID=R7U2B2_CAPTE|nr:hypothetical protein CAPTEDRAFT_229342 [Capitella teleta]|eukprot:ELU00470.1 hypothetical protein CAPTEDRAFT_229342 [Capitella teleta]
MEYQNLCQFAGFPYIIPESADEAELVCSMRGPCPLCSQWNFTEASSSKVKRHLRGFHRQHSIKHAGRKHLICRLSCAPAAHYHCCCGTVFMRKQRARSHIISCCKAEEEEQEQIEVEREQREEEKLEWKEEEEQGQEEQEEEGRGERGGEFQ